MIKWTYDFEVQTMVTMFMNAMSDIVIRRFNVHKETRDRIKTRIVYAPKQRVLNDLLNRDQNLQLPVIACYIGGIARDNGRVFNKILGSFNDTKYGIVQNEKMPLAIDLSLNVSIMTRYQADMDQILTHLLPYINPYFTVSWRTPMRQDHEIRSNVIWSGSTNITYPIDITSSQTAKVVADLSFTFKGWLFQAVPDENYGQILTIHTTYNNEINGIPQEYLLEDDKMSSSEYRDYLVIKGSPPQPKIIQPEMTMVGKRQQFNVYGEGFSALTNVYLSGSPLSSISTTHNPFAESIKLSAEFPPFTAVKLLSTDWHYDKESLLTFIMPSATNFGYVDLIVEGPAGYGALTKNVRLNEFNPFTPDSSDYQSFIPYQFPFLSGIRVIDNHNF
jgi:hypothetical protein